MNLRFLAPLLLLTGCATFIRGLNQEIQVSSTPPGAVVFVDDSAQGQTPTTVRVARKTAHVITVDLDGFEARSQQISPRSRNAWLATNVLWVAFGPVAPIAFVVDLRNGAHRHFPTTQFSFLLDRRVAVSPVRPDSGADLGVAAPSPVAPRIAPLSAMAPRVRSLIGQHVRVVEMDGPASQPRTTTGMLRTFNADTLMVRSGDSFHFIPARDVTSLEVGGLENQAPRRMAGRRAAVAIGGFGGFLIGGVASLGRDPGPLLPLLGAAAGAAIGSAMVASPPTSGPETWVKICCFNTPVADSIP